MRAPCPRMLTAALSVFTAAGGLSVAAAKKTLGPRISVFVVVVNIVRSVVNIVARPTTSSTRARAHSHALNPHSYITPPSLDTVSSPLTTNVRLTHEYIVYRVNVYVS